MCGIVGVYSAEREEVDLSESIRQLSKRGPDSQGSIVSGYATLGHTRLSILDTSTLGSQPMQDPTGRYSLIFNGEIYNYHAIALRLRDKGVQFISNTDTEVLLHLLIEKGEQALDELNGFFALAFHDKEKEELIVARDRYGIKPLYYAQDEQQLCFASELKAIMPLLEKKTLNKTALHFFFMLNYVPGNISIFNEVKKLGPGQFLKANATVTIVEEYAEQKNYPLSYLSYENAQLELRDALESAVSDRLVSDVPLGTFLSGGIDSSVISAIAAKQKPGLKTFSIGFKDNQFFDESVYSEMVAKHLGTDHHVFQLSNEQMLEHVDAVLDYTDEPFADSSAIAVHALSQMTRQQVTVSLSGDGADEIFGGYNKHSAHLRAIRAGFPDTLLKMGSPFLGMIPSSRSSAMGNASRQIKRYLKGAKLNPRERYWQWASFTDEEKVLALLDPDVHADARQVRQLKARYHDDEEGMSPVFQADLRMLLPGDFLPKVDRMSMANSLEVRVPFLDRRVVDLAMSLPVNYRINPSDRKLILKDAFRDMLPEEIFSRSKKGFEVPLEAWFKGPLRAKVMQALDPERSAGILSADYLKTLSMRVEQDDFGADVHLIWALIVFDRFKTRYLD